MEKLVFACVAPAHGPGLDFNVPLLAASIRSFAGTLSDCPIWVLIPESENEICKNTKEQLQSLDVTIIRFAIDPDILKFPFAATVRAATTAESLVENKSRFLTWMGLDTLIINEPTFFLLDDGKTIGYRPVHHTLIGSLYQEPIDPFWELLYRKCHVTEEKIFPMNTHVDHNILRPYFNAGHLVVRPEKKTLRTWWAYFEELYHDPQIEEFYKKNELYAVFIHQAVLTGIILSSTEPQELQELPFAYNYPLHLYHESPPDLQPQNVNDLVTIRYENQSVLRTTSFHGPLKTWLEDHLHALSHINCH
jgi:hypothetical protein